MFEMRQLCRTKNIADNDLYNANGYSDFFPDPIEPGATAGDVAVVLVGMLTGPGTGCTAGTVCCKRAAWALVQE